MTTSFLGIPIERHATLGSTNDLALRRAEEGAPEGLLVLAEVQTAGRGRQGRAWLDVAGRSLAFSVVLRPEAPLPRWPLFALAMACAVAEAGAEATASALEVKWPNDVLHQGRKLCGILAESRIPAGAQLALVIGTGVNVNHLPEEFPEELRGRATSLRIAGGGREIEPLAFLSMILPRFERYLALARDRGIDALREAVVARLPRPGTRVRVRSGGTTVEGRIEGFTETGAIRLRVPDRAEPLVLAAGEIV